MGKSRAALKFKKDEKASEPAYIVVGSVIRGYTVVNRAKESVFYSVKMWDAIDEKKRLLEGGQPLTQEEFDARSEQDS